MLNYTYDEIKEAHDALIRWWGEDGKRVIEAIFNMKGDDTILSCGMSMREFLQSCTACGGNWGGMLLSGIKRLFPTVWDAIPNDMGDYAWACICYTLLLCGINTKDESEEVE